MECYYHPEREGVDQCAICGKHICKECGLEIAGKIYCKECLEKIVGLGIESKAQEEVKPIVAKEPAAVVADEEIYQPQQEESAPNEISKISEDSPYKIRDNQETPAPEPEISYQKPKEDEIAKDDFIYPDHSYQPEVTSARQDLEDKYEKYLDDLYFDENDVPLNEQLAKDEAQYGSLTRKEYKPKQEEEPSPKEETPSPKEETPSPKRSLRSKKDPMNETPEEMEKRIREEILKEQELMSGKEEKNIHNLKDEKEPMGIVDIILTIILIIVILVVIYYIIYLLFLNASYPTFMDAVYALSNPQNVINNILSSS